MALPVDLYLLETWQRFQEFCFQLARAEHGYAVGMSTTWDGGRDVSVYGHVEGKTVELVALQCKFVRSLGADTKRSIRASLDAVDNIQRPGKWILCLPMDPTAPFLNWFKVEMERRGMLWEVWGRLEILARLKEHPHIFHTFFYCVFADLERAFVRDTLELIRFELDGVSQWNQPDPKVLAFFSAGNAASPDLVFDITVRNRGRLEAAVFRLVAQVGDHRPSLHGIAEEGLLLPKISYRISIGEGRQGDYESRCEPPLLIAPRCHQRFKICITDAGYAWSGTLQVRLDCGSEFLPLPCIQLHT